MIFWRLVGGTISEGLIYSASALVAVSSRVKYVVLGFMRPGLHAIYSASALVAVSSRVKYVVLAS